MATFVMFGRYTPEALKTASAARTKKAQSLIKRHKGELVAMYATLGKIDLVLVANFPGIVEAMQASIGLTKLTGIGFTTAPAVSVDTFDKLMADA